jgi:alkylation response protein AidB-like acyl-CoA dehydrogenase
VTVRTAIRGSPDAQPPTIPHTSSDPPPTPPEHPVDFDDTPEEAAFRAEANSWLAERAGPRTGVLHHRTMADDPTYVPEARAWQRVLYDGEWAGIAWPKSYGGRGGTTLQASIFAQEQARFEVAAGLFMVAIDMVGPSIIGHGTEAQKEKFLDAMLRGDHVWCQLFSEPGAGSDLGSLGTRAERDGDEWVVNGQKVWTSHAHHSDWGILLARTDPDAPKHRGISYFLLDMRTPGIEVRPLRQITGTAHFNEVFLTDVRIPIENMVGPPGGGWRVAMTTLTAERGAIGGGGGAMGWADLLKVAARSRRAADPLVRQELARAFTRMQLLRYLGFRRQTALSQGTTPGPESSVVKLLMSDHATRTSDLVEALLGAEGMLADETTNTFLNQWSVKIGGGTDQVQRNVIGERVLGLPKEPQPTQ